MASNSSCAACQSSMISAAITSRSALRSPLAFVLSRIWPVRKTRRLASSSVLGYCHTDPLVTCKNRASLAVSTSKGKLLNRCGSYRALLGNSQAALLAAIDAYNRPTNQYREETTVILLINAWELLFKAILSKRRIPIFYPKQRGEPRRSLTVWDAFKSASAYLPPTTPHQAVGENLRVLNECRNDAAHFYLQDGLGVIVNSLAQTSITNYREVLLRLFNVDIAERANLVLQPLGFGHSLDPLAYLRRQRQRGKRDDSVGRVINAINEAVGTLDAAAIDTGCFMTVYRVRLESVKKISRADLVVAVDRDREAAGAVVVVRPFDPNDPNWVQEKDIVAAIPDLHGRRFTTYVFRALVRKFEFRTKPQYCWIEKRGAITKYSKQLMAFFRSLDQATVEQAIEEYKEHLRPTRRRSKLSS